MIRITLPFPPSVNHYWRRVGPKTLVSKAGRQYRDAVQAACIDAGVYRRRFDQRARVALVAFPPDRRRRDLDNLLKATLDALVAAEVLTDDSLIDDLWIRRGPCDPRAGGLVRVEVEAV